MRHTRSSYLAITATLTLTLTSCSLMGGGDEEAAPPPATTTGATTGTTTGDGEAETSDGPAAVPPPETSDPGSVTLLTHDSFNVPEELVTAFEEESGYQLELQTGGDAGELTNQLVLTKGSPIADVVFGIDTTFGSRAVSEGVLAAYAPADLPASAEEHLLTGGETVLTPVDYGDVCVNVDDVWFANRGIAPPETLEDLTEPEYEDLFVTPGATTSSPGMAFLLATVGYFGQGEWQAYWQDLMSNGAKITSGWTDAYTVDFTAGGGDGDRPIVLSYASSPPFTIPEGGWQPTTRALLDTCFRQVEYAGVLEGAVNPEGAQAVVDWLVSPEVQASIPDSMFMFPVDDEVELPELWAEWAQVAESPIVVHPRQIEQERETWLREWADLATG
jgi:thiamine transport system substrate-binding protein